MNKRRLGGWRCVGAVTCLWAVVSSGCAQSERADGSKKVAAGADEGAEALLARQAAGLERVLKGEQAKKRATEGEGAVVQRSTPADQVLREMGSSKGGVETPAGASLPGAGERASTGAETTAVGATASVKPGAAVLSGWWGAASVVGDGEVVGASTEQRSAPVVSPSVAAASQFWKSEEGNVGAGAAGGPFRISALALCTRVDGFGKFTKVESVRAGSRPVPLLIYTQVDGFAYRTADGSLGGVEDGKTEWAVELGQSVVVYRMGADGKSDVQVKIEPERTARDVEKFKRRDHFLTEQIELPVPLVPGKYVVKVTLRDKATGMVDEKMAEVLVR